MGSDVVVAAIDFVLRWFDREHCGFFHAFSLYHFTCYHAVLRKLQRSEDVHDRLLHPLQCDVKGIHGTNFGNRAEEGTPLETRVSEDEDSLGLTLHELLIDFLQVLGDGEADGGEYVSLARLLPEARRRV